MTTAPTLATAMARATMEVKAFILRMKKDSTREELASKDKPLFKKKNDANKILLQKEKKQMGHGSERQPLYTCRCPNCRRELIQQAPVIL